MKITKSRLRSIILEEKAKIVNEMKGGSHKAIRQTNAAEQLMSAFDKMIEAFGNEDAFQEIQGHLDDWDHEDDHHQQRYQEPVTSYQEPVTNDNEQAEWLASREADTEWIGRLISETEAKELFKKPS